MGNEQGRISIERLCLRLGGPDADYGKRVAQRVLERLPHMLPNGLTGHVPSLELRVNVATGAGEEEIAESIAAAAARSIVKAAGRSGQSERHTSTPTTARTTRPGAPKTASVATGEPAMSDLETELFSAKRSGGEPLPPAVRRAMEPGLGTDLGNVKVYRDERAHRLAAAAGARAFTTGDDIFFDRPHEAVQSLSPSLRARFEGRLGQSLDDVRIHTGPSVDAQLEPYGALGATRNRDIALSSSVETVPNDRLRVLAHELVHVAQQTRGTPGISGDRNQAEREASQLGAQLLLPGKELAVRHRTGPSLALLTDFNGQSSANTGGRLTADLSSPVVVGRVVRFRAEISPLATFNPPALLRGPYPYYEWRIVDRDSGATVEQSWSPTEDWQAAYPRAGRFQVRAVLMDPSRGASAPLVLNQEAVPEDAALPGLLSSEGDYAAAERELVDDFRGFVRDAASATGPNGITARFLAAILREEIANTAISTLLTTNKASRHGETRDIQDAIRRRASGTSVPISDINRSVGVGQLRLSTAAMTQGTIPFLEQPAALKGPTRARVETNLNALSTTDLEGLAIALAWPKSNIQLVAATLAKLKNRLTRYPGLARAGFGANQRACQIIATEYNVGATTSAEVDAHASDYGRRIWQDMTLPVLTKFFSNS